MERCDIKICALYDERFEDHCFGAGGPYDCVIYQSRKSRLYQANLNSAHQCIYEGSSTECPECVKKQEVARQIIIVGNEFKRGQMPGEEFEQAVKHYLGLRQPRSPK